ncbi:hypothetical protein ABOZ73_17565 [Caulobacter sp. 73W]|uniref:Uncharacterized protein n=1 Tax=Caulobacter sp. 73W TaxID=3161137 RepID=A0AB39KSL4_9CAUL
MSLLIALLAAASTAAAQPAESQVAQDKPAAEKPAEKKVKMVCAKVETPGARVAKKVCRPATAEELAEAAGK